MAHVAPYSKVKIEDLLIDVFPILSGESDVFNFESGCLFFHESLGFLLFFIIFFN